MPELPDVEVFRQYLDATGLHQRIDTGDLNGDMLEGVTNEEFSRRLRGRELCGSRRHGKYLFGELEGDGGRPGGCG